jgi:hypothetical protein
MIEAKPLLLSSLAVILVLILYAASEIAELEPTELGELGISSLNSKVRVLGKIENAKTAGIVSNLIIVNGDGRLPIKIWNRSGFNFLSGWCLDLCGTVVLDEGALSIEVDSGDDLRIIACKKLEQ